MLLDDVMIPVYCYGRWATLARRAVDALPAPIDCAALGDEQAELLPDGRLMIFATYKGRRLCEMCVPASDWQIKDS